MRLIDTHTHAWAPNTNELPWKADVLPPEWEGPYTASQLIGDMDRASVDESVIVTTPLYGRGPRANEYTMRSISAYPDRLYGVGLVPYFKSEETMRDAVARVVGNERMLGVRMHAPFIYDEIPTELDPTADWILSKKLTPVWEEIESRNKSVFIFPKAAQISMIGTLAERHPDVPIVVDHMAWPDEETDANESPWADFRSVSDHDNVYVKLSSLPRSADSPWPYPDLHDYVRNLLEWFGPDRLMLGSDYPWMDSWAEYGQCLSWIEEAEFVSARDLSYLSYRTFDTLHR